ncbi:MAG: 6-phospho-3-hexuloisomerase [Methanocalculus sp. MSAO_Arc1]|uniref:6-phospho-3-hexuloisomerase n=1 Tax=Methanocalculus TaxID=71151 RepID=UPI000FECF7F0|nr:MULTISPECIES: 6-phospho-3-hexuloisomerase [unclassified Methanocalculus]MCP1661757.1 6-phospho-3-hexuloisomerase [Methanocalculus sp. AMF5]RQD81104.1 MAG: 6-phospho-3-hexuloisomerase [Methanocalculus sp. MSAO_Arc1]
MERKGGVQEMMRLMARKVSSIADSIENHEVDAFTTAILRSNCIYVMGAGRSGLVAKAFAMRLMHLGLTSYVVGETITPAIEDRDMIIAFSGSGNTNTVADIAETAKEIGSTIGLITSKKDSRIGKIADVVVVVESQRDEVTDDSHEYEIRQMMGEHRSFAPLGTLFETTAMIFSDALVSRLMELTETSETELKKRHTNIE